MPARKKIVPDLRFQKATGQFYARPTGQKPAYFGKDQAEAGRRYRRWAAEYITSQGQPIPPAKLERPGLTVAEVLARYSAHAQTRHKNAHIYRVWRAVEEATILYGPTPAADFGPRALKALRTHLTRLPSQNNDDELLSRTYVNELVGTIQTAWTWLESEELVPAGSAQHLRTVRALEEGDGGEESPPVLLVAAEVVEATLPHLSRIVRAMVIVHGLTGMRPGELVMMRPGRISRSPDHKVCLPLPRGKVFDVAALDVGAVRVWVYAPEDHKTRRRGKIRLVPLGPAAQAVLAPFLERPPESYCFSPAEARAELDRAKRAARQTRVQPSQLDRRISSPKKRPGQRYTTASYAAAVEAAAAKAGVEHWSPGQLRHTMSETASDAADLDTAAAVLGHATPDMTAYYIASRLRKAAGLAAQIG